MVLTVFTKLNSKWHKATSIGHLVKIKLTKDTVLLYFICGNTAKNLPGSGKESTNPSVKDLKLGKVTSAIVRAANRLSLVRDGWTQSSVNLKI